MAKVQKIAEITPNLPFAEFNFYVLYRSTFEKSELAHDKGVASLEEDGGELRSCLNLSL